ncbi:MAG: hypothetical protein ACRCZE_00305 [Candidatus Altimarinota bacterium]
MKLRNEAVDEVAKQLGYKPEQLLLPNLKADIQPVIRTVNDAMGKFHDFINRYEEAHFREETGEQDYQEFVTRGKIMLAQWIKLNNCMADEAGEKKSYLDERKLNTQRALEGMKILEVSGESETTKELIGLGAEVVLFSPYGATEKSVERGDESRKRQAAMMASVLGDITSFDSFDLINVDRNTLYYALVTTDEFEAEQASSGVEKIMKSINEKVYRKIARFGLLTDVKPGIAVEAFVKNLSK